MIIQVIDKNKLIFRVNNSEYRFIKPNYLFKDFGDIRKAVVKGSVMGWNIENDFLSYNKMKESFK